MAKNKPRKSRSNAATYKKMAMQEKMIESVISADRYRAFKQGEDVGFANATAVMLWLLHREYGYGAKRLMVFLHNISDFCNNYVIQSQEKQPDNEYQGISIDDICQTLFEETGIKVDPNTGTIEGPGVERAVRYTQREVAEEEQRESEDMTL